MDQRTRESENERDSREENGRSSDERYRGELRGTVSRPVVVLSSSEAAKKGEGSAGDPR